MDVLGRWRRWLATLVALHLLVVLVLVAARRQVVRLDHAVDRALYEKLPEKAERVCYVMLQGGSSHTVLAVGGIVSMWLIARRHWKRLIAWAVLLAGCVALDVVLKRAFHRPRPLNMEGWPGWSFPSGHVLAVTAVYGMVAWLIVREGWMTWRAAAGAMAAMVIVTAVALLLPGYHFVSDLIAGYFVGVGWLTACLKSLTSWEGRGAARTDGPEEPEAALP